MIYWLASLGYQAFGVSEWSATLAPIACSALSAGLLFLLAYRWWGLAVAALAGAFMVFVPMDAYYGRMVNHEAPTLLFSLLSFYLYTLWKEKRSRGYFAALLGSLALAALSDFPGFFVGPWLAVYHFFSGPRRTTWKASLALLLSSPAFFLAWTAYLRWISGSFEILTSRFAMRTESWAPWVFTLGELYRLEFLRVRGLYTPTLLLLAAVWLAFMAWDVWHGRDLRRHGFLAMLGGFGVTYLALFHQNAYQHDFVAYYLTPFMCIAPAWAVTLLAGRLLSPRPAVVALLSVIVFVPFLGEAMATLRQMYATRESAYVRVAQRLNGALPPGGKVLASVEDSTRNQWLFYLDRQTLPAADLGALEAHLRDPDVRYYVLDTRLSETTQELRDYLARRYPVEVMGPFLVFDLRGEGPGLVLDRLPEGVRAPAGEGYRDPYLTLAGYSLPAELSRPPVAPENEYLYSSSDYWPPDALAGNLSPDALARDAGNPGGLDPRLRGGDGQATPSFPRTRESRAFTSFPGVVAGGWPAGPDIPVQATLYWRVEQPVPEGHALGVTLRGAYDRTYVVEPTYAPQAAAFPPQSWQPGRSCGPTTPSRSPGATRTSATTCRWVGPVRRQSGRRSPARYWPPRRPPATTPGDRSPRHWRRPLGLKPHPGAGPRASRSPASSSWASTWTARARRRAGTCGRAPTGRPCPGRPATTRWRPGCGRAITPTPSRWRSGRRGCGSRARSTRSTPTWPCPPACWPGATISSIEHTRRGEGPGPPGRAGRLVGQRARAPAPLGRRRRLGRGHEAARAGEAAGARVRPARPARGDAGRPLDGAGGAGPHAGGG